MDPATRLVGDALCVTVCVIAAAFDLRRRRIPDLLTLPAAVSGLVLAGLSGGSHDVVAAATGLALLGGLFALFAAAGAVGWGDAKLMAAVGALLGWPLGAWSLVLYALLYSALAGGLLGLALVVRRRLLGAALRGIVEMARSRRLEPGSGSGLTLPYGVAIAAGTVLTVAGRYLPALLVG